MNESNFSIISSNSQEELLQQFFKIIYSKEKSEPANPLIPEIVLIQNHGFKKWISLKTAETEGILANTKFLFPNELIQMIFQNVLSGSGETHSSKEMQWKLMEILLDLPADSAFDTIRSYLNTGQKTRAFDLASMLAELFDQYEIFRTDTILEWEQSAPDSWVAKLWKMLPDEIRLNRKPFLKERLFQQFEKMSPAKGLDGFTKRITVFGISYLSPFYLDILKALSQFTEIHFLYFNPSMHFWGDTVAEVQEKRAMLGNKTAENLHIDIGNPLLSTLGKYGRDFFNLLMDDDITADLSQLESDTLAQGDNLLHKLQMDIFRLNNPKDHDDKKVLPEGGDHSIQFHSCYSKMREVEVLKDQLLDLFQNDENSTFAPEDILVMTPDIEEYAPIIQAVFQRDETEQQDIPYSIADRVFTKESKVIQYFLKILEVIQSRFSVNGVMSLFESEAIREKFSLSESELDSINDWLERVNIRWGIDRSFKKTKGLPETHENSWQFGLDRLLSGVGLASGDKILLTENTENTEILPFDDIEGGDAFMFGRFLDFYEELVSLFKVKESAAKEGKTIREWVEVLRQIPSVFFSENQEWDQELLLLEMALSEMEQQAEVCSDDFRIDIEVVQSYLQKELGALIPSRGFMGNGVTFCSMKPMRSIPFKFVAILGLENKAFPRISAPLSFDQLNLSQTPGDRSVKEEDRYLFLETLLCARERLYLSYVGQSMKDNTELSPSTLVLELQNYLEESYLEKGELQKHLITQHPLQAFSRRYFQQEDGKLFSYSEENQLAAKALLTLDKKPSKKFELHFSDVDESFFELSIDTLVKFFDNPAKFLLNKRFGVYLDSNEKDQDENEPFKLGYLEKYIVRNQLQNALLHGGEVAKTGKILKIKGMLPHSHAGQMVLENLTEEMQKLVEKVRSSLSEPSLEDYYYNFTLGKYHLKGKIGMLWTNTNLNFRPSSVKLKDRLRSWLEHLVLNYLKPEAYPTHSTLIGYVKEKNKEKNKIEVYMTEAFENPAEQLGQILDLYLKGLREPLALFPRSALNFMTEYKNPENKVSAWSAAKKEWEGDFSYTPEYTNEMDSDRYFKKCFGNLDLQGETDFEENVLQLSQMMFLKQEMKND